MSRRVSSASRRIKATALPESAACAQGGGQALPGVENATRKVTGDGWAEAPSHQRREESGHRRKENKVSQNMGESTSTAKKKKGGG